MRDLLPGDKGPVWLPSARGLYRKNVLAKVKMPKVPQVVIPTFSEKELSRLLSQPDRAANKKVQQLAEGDSDALLLMTIRGMGYYCALLTDSEIRDVKHFRSAKQLCAYAGLVPSTHASGNACFHGHITKQGSRWLRWILIEAAIRAVKRSGVLRRFYFKIERKKGGQIAKVAAARKLLEWIYHILRDSRTYQEM